MNDPLAIVTGAPGWLGTRLVEVLRRGMSEVPGLEAPLGDRIVRCLVLPGADVSRVKNDRVELVEGDVRDPEAVAKLFDGAKGATLFHAAGVIHPTHGTKELFAVNARGTQNVVEAAERAGIRRMVHVSSNSPIGTNPSHDHVFDEGAPYNPYMDYGRSKKMAEETVQAAGVRGTIETVIIRPPWFYGPGQPPRQALFFEMIRDGKAPIVGGGENRRSMAYVDNICQGLLLCERVARAKGGIYWIADRRPYAMNEIVDTIERVIEKDFGVTVAHRRMKLPGIASGVAYMMDAMFQGMGMYQQKIHVLSEMNKTIACTVAKAEAELGYDPKIELEEGMRRSIRWMLDNGGKLSMSELHLVTGGAGYFGTLLVKRIRDAGHRVRIFDINDADNRPADVEMVRADIRDAQAVVRACDGVSVIHHNVALVPLAKDKKAFFEVNRDGTKNLLEAALEKRVRKVIHMSSSAVFGAPDENPVDESTAPRPQEDYGKAKLAAEDLCAGLVKKGLDITIVRPRTIMGHGRLGIMQILFEWIRTGKNVPVLGRGDNLYQFVHADDLADACIAAAKRAGPNLYNIGAEKFCTMRETLEGLAAHAGTGSRVVSVPAGAAVRMMELTSRAGLSPLGPYHSLMYGRTMYFDVSKAKADLAFAPRWGNVEMFCQSYDWYLEHRDEVFSRRNASHHRSPVKQGVLRVVGWALSRA